MIVDIMAEFKTFEVPCNQDALNYKDYLLAFRYAFTSHKSLYRSIYPFVMVR